MHIAIVCIVAWLFCANLILAVAVENYQDKHIWDSLTPFIHLPFLVDCSSVHV